jgi:heme a synthase
MNSHSSTDRKWITTWLFIGVVMVFFQILLGGITRLTGSGLSITRWEIVTGTVPPLNATEWQEAFDLYKETPQYQQINAGMSLSQFKFIFFWEYLHRLWARTMGFVFLFPFIFFLWRRSLSKEILRRLLVVVILAAVAALFGWIMVASGLINRPWVNAYKLTVHLCLGISLFIFLGYTWLKGIFNFSSF